VSTGIAPLGISACGSVARELASMVAMRDSDVDVDVNSSVTEERLDSAVDRSVAKGTSKLLRLKSAKTVDNRSKVTGETANSEVGESSVGELT
jgi:hypothetical protein